MHLDHGLVIAHSRTPISAPSEVASRVERLRAAFSRSPDAQALRAAGTSH